jgi:hypothetical protein
MFFHNRKNKNARKHRAEEPSGETIARDKPFPAGI